MPTIKQAVPSAKSKSRSTCATSQTQTSRSHSQIKIHRELGQNLNSHAFSLPIENQALIPIKKMISVRNQIVFVYDKSKKFFYAKQTISNNVPFHVSYIVRASKPDAFKIHPMHGLVGPGDSLQIHVKTEEVEEFGDLLYETIMIYGVPLYDPIAKRMEEHHLNLMWKSIIEQKRKFLACNSSPELENVCFYLPQNDDSYFSKIPLTGKTLEICLILTRDTPLGDMRDNNCKSSLPSSVIRYVFFWGLCLIFSQAIFCALYAFYQEVWLSNGISPKEEIPGGWLSIFKF